MSILHVIIYIWYVCLADSTLVYSLTYILSIWVGLMLLLQYALFIFWSIEDPRSAHNLLRWNGTKFPDKIGDDDDLFAKISSQKSLKFCFRFAVKKKRACKSEEKKLTLHCNHLLKYFILGSNLDM